MEACRRDNVELFHEVLSRMESKRPEEIADFFNGSTDVTGNYLLHICATYGNCTLPLPDDLEDLPANHLQMM